jgi:N-methylhydantoinase B
MAIDGYCEPMTLTARTTISDSRIAVDFAGSLPVSGKGINCPMSYAKAYAIHEMRDKAAVQLDIENGHVSQL